MVSSHAQVFSHIFCIFCGAVSYALHEQYCFKILFLTIGIFSNFFCLTFSNSPGIMLLILTKASGHVPLKILSIEDGTVLKSFNHLLHRNKKVDFIEQFNEKLLVKQENENLQILDVMIFLETFCNSFCSLAFGYLTGNFAGS